MPDPYKMSFVGHCPIRGELLVLNLLLFRQVVNRNPLMQHNSARRSSYMVVLSRVLLFDFNFLNPDLNSRFDLLFSVDLEFLYSVCLLLKFVTFILHQINIDLLSLTDLVAHDVSKLLNLFLNVGHDRLLLFDEMLS